MNTPATLFKYESYSLQNLENLKNQRIFFAHPKRFNDSFDRGIPLRLIPPSDSDAITLRKALGVAKNCPIPEIKRKIHNLATSLFEKVRDTTGIACFTETNDNLLMWSHYAGRATGWCLEFHTRYEPFSKARPVVYSDCPPKIASGDLVTSNGHSRILDAKWCTKSKDWQYEHEWRSLHEKADKEFGYPCEALKAVYFGPETSRITIEIVCLVLAGQHDLKNIELYRGSRSETEFKVNFEKFEYTSYRNAIQLGLINP